MPTILQYLKLSRKELLEEQAKIQSAISIGDEQSKLLDEMEKDQQCCHNCIHYEGWMSDDCVLCGRCVVSELMGGSLYVQYSDNCPKFALRAGPMAMARKEAAQ